MSRRVSFGSVIKEAILGNCALSEPEFQLDGILSSL